MQDANNNSTQTKFIAPKGGGPTNRKLNILCCDDEQSLLESYRYLLHKRANVDVSKSAEELKFMLKKKKYDLLFLDVHLGNGISGLKLIEETRTLSPDTLISISSGDASYANLREALREGAFDFLAKPFNEESLTEVIKRAESEIILRSTRDQLAFEQKQNREMAFIGNHPSIEKIRKMVEKIALSNGNVIIFGETGTGKEVVARMFRDLQSKVESQLGNQHSSRQKNSNKVVLPPFVALDSATIQSNTAESSLFGYEKGAFTGADKQSRGAFEEADGGIIYFDELANMPLDIQAKLLRVVQEKEVCRMGSVQAIPLQFRVIAATNQDLEVLVKEGKFKDDLYQRLSVFTVEIPPLRDRLSDIPILVGYLLDRESPEKRPVVSDEVLEIFQKYSWPGNVRELSNLMTYLITMCENNLIQTSDLPKKFQTIMKNQNQPFPEIKVPNPVSISSNSELEKEILGQSYRDFMDQMECKYLNTRVNANSNLSRCAQEIVLDRSHLYQKLKKHGITAKKDLNS